MRHATRGFSLVEMLVVIAIVSVLAAMLLPTVEGSLAAARDVQCRSNMRQIACAQALYAEDFKGYADGAENSILPYQRLAERGYIDNPWPGGIAIPQRTLPKGVWNCPSVVTRIDAGLYGYDDAASAYMNANYGVGGFWYAGSYVTHYVPNACVTSNSPQQWGWGYGEWGAYATGKYYRLEQIVASNRVVLFFDGISYRYNFPYGFQSPDPGNWIWQRHGGHMNAAYWDLHVGAVRFSDVLHSSANAAEWSRYREDGMPTLFAPHGKIDRNGNFRAVHPSELTR